MTTTVPDFAHTKGAEHNRVLKARKIARWMWDRDLTFSDVLGADEKRRRAWARAAGVTPPSTMETWQAVNDALLAMEGFKEDNPNHPATARPHADERATWLGEIAEPEVRTWVCDRCMGTVHRDEIADYADGEHVLCKKCLNGAPLATVHQLHPHAVISKREPGEPARTPLEGLMDAGAFPMQTMARGGIRYGQGPEDFDGRPVDPAIAETVKPAGWDELVALGPIGRPDARCSVCRIPAVTATPSARGGEWRCALHPPQPGEWGAALNFAPGDRSRHAEFCPQGRRCYDARCPNYKLAPAQAETRKEARRG